MNKPTKTLTRLLNTELEGYEEYFDWVFFPASRKEKGILIDHRNRFVELFDRNQGYDLSDYRDVYNSVSKYLPL